MGAASTVYGLLCYQ